MDDHIPTPKELYSIAKIKQIADMLTRRRYITDKCIESAKAGNMEYVYNAWLEPETIAWLEERGFDVYQSQENKYHIGWEVTESNDDSSGSTRSIS